MAKSEKLLWEAYKKDPSMNNRNALVENYAALAKNLAMGFYRTYGKATLDSDDFAAWGMMGLISAVENYDNNKNTQFSTYAYSRIRGAILDNLNKLGNLPRTIAKKLSNLAVARRDFIATFGKNPSPDELASAMKMSMKSIDELLTLERDMAQSTNTETVELVSEEPKDPVDYAETKELVFRALDTLDDRDYKIFKGIYVEHRTFREVGAALKCTGSYVSLRNAVILDKIKEICGGA